MIDLDLLREGQIWVYKDKIIITDNIESLRQDAVFPLCQENLYFIENLKVAEGSLVLDLCTGSGIFAIFAAEKAKKVVAVDINPRAIQFARLNAALNGVDHKIEFILGDLFQSIKKTKFDLIISNPPFEPTPKGWKNYIHSDGGDGGSCIVERIMNELPDYLSSSGNFEMIVFLLKNKLGLIKKAKEILHARKVAFKYLRIINAEKFASYQYKRLVRLQNDNSKDMGEFVSEPIYEVLFQAS